jgi:hypothetical protein
LLLLYCPFALPGHQCIHTVSELKKGAMISDFDTLVANVQNAGNLLYSDAHVTNRCGIRLNRLCLFWDS